jgi:hypothetical protein
MTTKASKLFHFLRGALRGTYGDEDLRRHRFLIIGTSKIGQELLSRLCVGGIDIKFQDQSLTNHHNTFAVCSDVDVYTGEPVDVIVDFSKNVLHVKNKSFPFDKIGEDAYTQGIHEFYL